MDLPLPPFADAVPPQASAPTHSILMPDGARGPMVFASPHSGRDYPPVLLEAARLDPLTLRRSEDSFLETLFESAPRHGAPLIHALFPRVWCDVNREAWELDPAMFEDKLPDFVNVRSPRVAAGLGTIARVVATGEPIYRRRLSFAEVEHRIATCWQPFHAALATLVEEARAAHGFAILIDCHSMPSVQAGEGRATRMPDFVLGDAHGTACAAALTGRIEATLTSMGYSVRRNDPYAGGYITRHYGAPRRGVHAIQLEISRALYMDEQRVEPAGSLGRLRQDLERLVGELAGTDWRAGGLAG
jgi:N-formylglutamate amidohydrolase